MNCQRFKKVTIYQGEPFFGKLNIYEGEGDSRQYEPSFEGNIFNAILTAQYGNIIKHWSSESGDITIGTETKQEQTAAWASFGMDGDFTATLSPGEYSLELSRVIANGKEIGKLSGIIEVKQSIIK